MNIRDISFAYGDKVIFRDFSLEIPDTGITALSGASGSGKTTLLRLIAGLETPDKGTITAPSRERIAVMFQEDRLLPGIPARKQLSIAIPDCDPDYWLERVGLKGEEDTVPEELSGGMKRRIALARCLAYAKNRELILLDEPFTGIDPDRIRHLTELIRNMDIPVIVTAHTEETLKLADRVIGIKGVG